MLMTMSVEGMGDGRIVSCVIKKCLYMYGSLIIDQHMWQRHARCNKTCEVV